MQNHLKRLSAPRSWKIDRATNVYIMKPMPGAHSLERGLPLGLLLRDHLKIASTLKEVKMILVQGEVLVDGKKVTQAHYNTGLFDVLSLPKINKNYRLLLDKKGILFLKEIPAAENAIKLCKIVGKTALKAGKIQFHFHDGKNILVGKEGQEAKVGDTFLLTLPELKIKEVLSLKAGALVFLTQGKQMGELGNFQEFKGREAKYTFNQEERETARDYLFVVGEKKALHTVN